MSRFHKFTTNRGLSLVELLVSLSIVGIISILVINYLLGGLESYNTVSSDVNLHNEANYIMTVFTKHIYEATDVSYELVENPKDTLIKISKLDEELTIGFVDNLAVIKEEGEEPRHLSSNTFLCTNSSITIDDHTVTIRLILEDSHIDGKNIELVNKVSFVNKGGGD